MAINSKLRLEAELATLNLMVQGLKFTSISQGYNCEKHFHFITLRYVKHNKEHSVRCQILDSEILDSKEEGLVTDLTNALINKAYEAVYDIEVRGNKPNVATRNSGTLHSTKQRLKNLRLLWTGKRKQKDR